MSRDLLRGLLALGGGALGVAAVHGLGRWSPGLGAVCVVLGTAAVALALQAALGARARTGRDRALLAEAAAALAALLALPALHAVGAGPAGDEPLRPDAVPPALELALRAGRHPALVWAALWLAALPAPLLVGLAPGRRLEVVGAAAAAALLATGVAAAGPRTDVLLLAPLVGLLAAAGLTLADELASPRETPGPALDARLGALAAAALVAAAASGRVAAALPPVRAGPDATALLRDLHGRVAAHRARHRRLPDHLQEVGRAEGLADGHALRYAAFPDGRWAICADPLPWRPGSASYRLGSTAPGAPVVLEVGWRPFGLRD